MNLKKLSEVKGLMKLDFDSFEYFIKYSFRWHRTPQGAEYWNEISQRKVE